MSEQIAQVGELEICFEVFGADDAPALLLVMGLGTQMLGWPDGFCELLAARGFRVIRYDNRDVGRSTHCTGCRVPTIRQLALRDRSAAAYSLSDMASDGIGLLDQLGIERAHVVGASMGGMIAQLMAIEHPDHVRSLASIMSNTGHRWKGTPGLRIYPVLLRRPARDRDGAVDDALATLRRIGSPEFPFDEQELRRVAQRSYDRGFNPAGTMRQLAAIVTAGDRAERLRGVTAPTVVIHGTRDLMVRPSGGRATAKAIPGARLVQIAGMGHDFPRAAWDRIVDAVVANARRADDARQVSAA